MVDISLVYLGVLGPLQAILKINKHDGFMLMLAFYMIFKNYTNKFYISQYIIVRYEIKHTEIKDFVHVASLLA